MRVPAEEEVEARVRGLPVELRRVREEDRRLAVGHGIRGLLDVVDAEEVAVVHPREMQHGAVALQGHRLVQEQPDAHVLEGRDHAHAVVVAEDRVDRVGEVQAQPAHALDGGLHGAEGPGPVVAREHAEVVVDRAHLFDQGRERVRVHVQVQVREVQDPQPVEGVRQPRQEHLVLAQLQRQGVAAPAPVEAAHAEQPAEHGRRGAGMLEVQEVQPAAEHLPVLLVLDAQALAGVGAAEAPREGLEQLRRIRVLVRRPVHAAPTQSRPAPNSTPVTTKVTKA